jgi:D-alanyl-D-alanine carboxypeptidase
VTTHIRKYYVSTIRHEAQLCYNSPVENLNQSHKIRTIVRVIAALLVVAIIASIGYLYVEAQKENNSLLEENKQLQEALQNTNDSLTKVQSENIAIVTALEEERQKSSRFANQIDNITNTVESLQRLSMLDKELLQKYSKVYFLSENYKPSALSPIDTKFLFTKTKPIEFHDNAWPFLRRMLEAANSENVPLLVASAYRSFGTQAQLKSSYRVIYGAGTANQFSAEQGYSEHQLGTTLDFTTPTVGGSFAGFDKTDAYTWLKNNAHRYGFVLSYPQGNKFYVYEPWHWRFVGLDLAERLHNEGKNFYDLEQREIDNYLGGIFHERPTTQ